MIATHRDGAVLTARIDNPPRQYMTRAMIEELHALLDRVEADAAIRAVVFTGTGDRFITHYDVEEILRGTERAGRTLSYRAARALVALARTPVMRHPRLRGAASVLRFEALMTRMNRSDRIFVAAVNGMALGAGCVFALACDLRVMAGGGGGEGGAAAPPGRLAPAAASAR